MHWIKEHFRRIGTPESGQKALIAYRLGIKAGGALRGVSISSSADSCSACRAMAGRVYQPDDVPPLPVEGCTNPQGCSCVYRPVMTYES